MKTKIIQNVKSIIIILAFVIGVSYVSADWTNPSVAPTGGNVPAPINAGTTPQAKNGPLTIGGLNPPSASYELDVPGLASFTGIATQAFTMTTGAAAGKVLTSDASGATSWQTIGTSGSSNPIVALNVPYNVTTNIPANTCTNAIKLEMNMDGMREDGPSNDNGEWNWFVMKDGASVIGTLSFGSRKTGDSGHGWAYWVSGMTRIIYITTVGNSHSLIGQSGSNSYAQIKNYTVTGGTGLPVNSTLKNPSYSVTCI